LHLFNTTFSEFSKHIVDRVSTAATRGKETTMQVATIDNPKFFGWERYFADAKRDEPPIESREAVRLSEDAVYSLVDFESDDFFFKAESLGWDMRRQHGGWDGEGYGAGYDMFATLFAVGGGTWRHPEGYCDQIWESFDRPRADSDRLIIDLMDEALHYGWGAPPEVLAEIEKLRDMRSASEAERKAAKKAREDAQFARAKRCSALDDAAYDDWLEAGGPDGRALKFSRWKERRQREDETIARLDILRAQQIEMRDAAENEWLAFNGTATAQQIDAWKEKHKELMLPFKRKLEPVTIHPFPTPPLPTPPFPTPQPVVPALEAPQPFVWRDPSTIPMMPWIYGKHLLRGCVSLTVAPSGVGKTFQKVMETVAMVTGRMLLHDKPVGQLRCWFYNGEEPMEILERRFQAAFLHHKIRPQHIGDRLFVNDRKTKMVIARQTRDGVTIIEPVRELLISYIRKNQIDVLSIDPFVSAHAVTENDNVAIDQVVKAYADVAQETNCAIDLVHHSRKTNGAAVGIEDARGASAAIGAVRAARTMNFMSPEEAAKAGVENRFRYVRIDDAKPNHAPRSESAQWVKFQGVYLGNGPMGLAGDNVAAMVCWEWPDAMAGVTSNSLTAAWEAVRAGIWRESSQAADWVGKPIAKALGLDLDKPADKAKVKGMVHRWIKSGELIKVEGLDERRHSKIFVEVGNVQVTPHSAPPPPAHP
jgi:hypothetical protein